MNFLRDLCEKKDLVMAENTEDGARLITIMSKDGRRDNTLNISIKDGELESYIINSKGKIIENFNKIVEDEDLENTTLSEIVDTFDAINTIDDDLIDMEESAENSDESYSSIDSGLADLRVKAKWIGDMIKNLTDYTDDVEFISVLLDLSSSAYSLYLDIESAIETYNELMNPDETLEDVDVMQVVEESLSESKSKLVIAKSLMEVRRLADNNKIEKEKLDQFETAYKELFNE